MRKEALSIAIGTLLALAGTASARNSLSAGGEKKAAAVRESWYLNVGLGLVVYRSYPPASSYADEVYMIEYDAVKSDGMILNVLSSADFGAYVPVNRRMALGPAVTIVSDHYRSSYYGYSGWEHIHQATYAASGLLFLRPEIGRGLFVRADAGVARAYYPHRKSDLGLGGLVASGYSHPILGGTRLVYSAAYGIRRIEGGTYTSVNIDMSVMF